MDEMEELFGSNDVREIALSYSRISDFDRNGSRSLTQRTFVGGDGVKIGGLTDDLITDFINKTDLFKEKYYEFNGEKPTAQLGKLADIVLENYKKIPKKNEFIKLIKDNNLWTNIKNNDILVKKIYESDLLVYLKAQLEAKNKVTVSTSQVILANELKDLIIMHDNSNRIFEGDHDLIVQHKFKFEYKSFLLRGILDFILIDHKNKTVEMIDLKTGKNSLLEFSTSYVKWRYYLQECIYVKAFKQICKDLNLKGYKLLSFKFLYISRFEKIPFIFNVSNKWHKAAIKGFETKAGFKYRGLDELLEEIKWHLDNKVFDLPRLIYESDGTMDIKDDYIVPKK